jgi:DNA-binding CsgD family transcriptional regulator
MEHPASARELRQSIKKTQSNDAYLRLYLHLGQQLFEHGWHQESASNLLGELCTLLAAEHGLIATENMGKLTVLCNRGTALPIGARIPMMGALANMLKNPVRFNLQQGVGNHLWTHAEVATYQDCIIPIANQQRSLGILALSGKQLQLNQEDIQTLHAIAGIIGVAMLQQQPREQTNIDRSILENLTPREREIFALMPAGLSNIELANKLGIAPGTAKIHVERILNKLNVKDRTQAAVKAVELGYKS